MKFRTDLPESGGKNFLKLKDQESVSGIFRGDLYEYFAVWENGKTREVPEGTPNSSFKFRINFVIREGTSYVPKIFQGPTPVYKQLAELHHEYNLPTTVIKIIRNGTGQNTTYSLLPLLKQVIPKETLAFLDKIDLLPLTNEKVQKSEGEEEFGSPPPNFNDSEIPF